jgi:hypothetical protein
MPEGSRQWTAKDREQSVESVLSNGVSVTQGNGVRAELHQLRRNVDHNADFDSRT